MHLEVCTVLFAYMHNKKQWCNTLSYGHCASAGSTSSYILTFTTWCCHRVTVCISVCLSHASIVWKRLQWSSYFWLRLLFVDYTLRFQDIRHISKVYILPNSGRRKFGHGSCGITKCDINNDSHWHPIDTAKCYQHWRTIIACWLHMAPSSVYSVMLDRASGSDTRCTSALKTLIWNQLGR